MEIIIREAQLIDSESITTLSHQLGYETLEIDTRTRLNVILKSGDHCVFVAQKNDEIVGWIHGFYTLRIESDFFVEIGGLVVNENFRKIGVGKLLVEKVTEWSKLKNCNKITVRCNVIRKESHQFYENIGFVLNKEQKIFNLKSQT